MISIDNNQLLLKTEVGDKKILDLSQDMRVRAIGYADMSHEDEAWQPTEVAVWVSSNDHNRLIRLLLTDDVYMPKSTVSLPKCVSDFLPVEMDTDLNSYFGNHAMLVLSEGDTAGLRLLSFNHDTESKLIITKEEYQVADYDSSKLIINYHNGRIILVLYKGQSVLKTINLNDNLVDVGVQIYNSIYYNLLYNREYV